MLASSSGRVPTHTASDVNQKIRERFHRCVEHFSQHPSEIPRRLRELDREWDIERTLAALSSMVSLFGLTLGASRDRRLLAIPAVVQGFYLQHTLQGWCPPLPVLRRLGFRTATEIEREKCALKDILRDRNPDAAQGRTARGAGQEDEDLGPVVAELEIDVLELR